MEGRLFTFLGTIGGHGQEWIILSHYVLVIGIIFLIARAATRKLQLVPTGAQNVMETFVGGIITMGADTMGDKNARVPAACHPRRGGWNHSTWGSALQARRQAQLRNNTRSVRRGFWREFDLD